MASDLARLTDSYEPDQSAVSLAQLTDYAPQGITPDADGVRRVLITKPNVAPDGMDYVDQPLGANVNASVGSKIDEILNKLTGANRQERYQLWPEKVIRGGLSAAGDVLAGEVPRWAVDKDTGEVHTSPQMIEKAQEISALAGTGGLAGADATLGATPFLRPALKYKDKIYKGKEGQQHQDVIPKDLYPEFEQMAMNGEDISHYNFGFMNHKGQFLNREKALEYAINEGLVDAHAGQYGALTSTLMTDSSKPGMAIEAMKANPFYSAVERNVRAIPQDKMTGDQWLGTLSNKPGVKPEELQWTGVSEFLKENGNKPVTKTQIEDHLASNKVELREVNKNNVRPTPSEEDIWKNANLTEKQWMDLTSVQRQRVRDNFARDTSGNTKYHSYQLPGGENYREMLLTLPTQRNAELAQLGKELEAKYGHNFQSKASKSELDRYNKLFDESLRPNQYKSSHWDEPNILAHVRMNDRAIDGKKSLHLEEIQSDWHQQGRDKGYNDANFKKAQTEYKDLDTKSYSAKGEELEKIENRMLELQKEHGKFLMSGNDKIPDAPFKKSWHELALKRMIREAAEKGYDRLSWTPGEAQAARYDLSNPNTGYSKILDKKGNDISTGPIPKDKLADTIGKEAANKLLESKPNNLGIHSLTGQDLKIGGEGMKGFYDQIIPKTLEKLGKEHGVKVKSDRINKPEFSVSPEKLPNGREVYDVKVDGKLYSSFHTKEEALAVAAKAEKEKKGTSIHYIDLPQSLKDQAMRGFPLFSSGVPIDLLDNKK